MLFSQSKNAFIVTDHCTKSIKMLRLDDSGKCSRVYNICQIPNDTPTGICMTRSGNVVVSDTGTRSAKLALFESKANSLEKLHEFAVKGTGEGHVNQAYYIAVDNNDRVVVSDIQSKEVKILSLEGRQLMKFSCSCSFDGLKEMEPQGVAVDDCNNILVADQAMKSVGMFTCEGVLVGHVATTKGQPWGVAYLDHMRLLAVATSAGLEVFEL